MQTLKVIVFGFVVLVFTGLYLWGVASVPPEDPTQTPYDDDE